MSSNKNEFLVERFQAVKSQIRDLAELYHRKPNDIQLLAVTKTQPSKAIAELHRKTGQTLFGENYVQELEEKASELSSLPIQWHFIGKLQSNKISRLVEICSCIQTVESEKHVRYIAKYAAAFGKIPFPVYISVNAGDEQQKSGISPSEVAKLEKIIAQQPELRLEGIMAIPPSQYSDDNNQLLPELYQQLSTLAKTTGNGKLSLGMSKDLKLAIQSGSTCVRIGRAIFGERL